MKKAKHNLIKSLGIAAIAATASMTAAGQCGYNISDAFLKKLNQPLFFRNGDLSVKTTEPTTDIGAALRAEQTSYSVLYGGNVNGVPSRESLTLRREHQNLGTLYLGSPTTTVYEDINLDGCVDIIYGTDGRGVFVTKFSPEGRTVAQKQFEVGLRALMVEIDRQTAKHNHYE